MPVFYRFGSRGTGGMASYLVVVAVVNPTWIEGTVEIAFP